MVSSSGSKARFAAFGPDPKKGQVSCCRAGPRARWGVGHQGQARASPVEWGVGGGVRGHRAGLAIRFRGSEAPEDKWSNNSPREPPQKMTW